MNTKLLFLLALLLCAAGAPALAQCVPNPDPTTNFLVYRPGGSTPVTELCVGNVYRLKDASGRNIPPALVRYAKLPALTCNPADTDTSTFYTPAAAGTVVITQNTPSADPLKLGVIFGRSFVVRALPDPSFVLTTCSPGVVQVTIDDQIYDQYLVQIGNAPAAPAFRNTPTPYPTGSATTVRVTGIFLNGCTREATKSFTPKPAAVQPRLRRLDALNGSFTFQFGPLQTDYDYLLQQTGGPGQPSFPVSAGLASLTIPATPDGRGCYRLLLSDACSPSVTSLASNELCAETLTGTSADGRNILTWTPANAAATYVLLRNGVALPAGASPYSDSVGITCGVTYRYRLEATVGTGATAAVSTAETSVLTSARQMLPVPRVFASFNPRNQVQLTATVPNLPAGGQLLYLRNGQPLATTARRTLLDSTLVLSQGACYSVRFTDACGNQSAAGASFCPVLLTAKAADADGTRAQLTWSALGSPVAPGTVRYTVEAQLADGSWRPVSAALTDLEFLDLQPPTDRQLLRYRVAASAPGQPVSYSNVASVPRQLKVFLPTAFSPNGDGLNDVLEVKGRFLTTFRFVVVDRNGQEVFRATDRTQTWNGRIGNEPPVLGAYVWRFEATDETGQRVLQHGTITIVK
ncbi:T9SS type B sorting domain-containing protein [Hymenobacter persicinus]|uniref:Gliding motility-associated C-terminal domain-containing protein n=1 Tax=Hymenobacter persicinus TaxID=2025506 RepID=A0A4Q5L8T6_9BACT|nr:gliding motility-associated C-terminal domain-containing protein [Hymenobacter persicinus]RYU78063.1 gliding motility-associated C-terminal domain-containing protein [Hymenobacter persicinus]